LDELTGPARTTSLGLGLWLGLFTEFTEFTDVNMPHNAGMSSLYYAYYHN